MKLKLDENLGLRGAEVLRQAGHDVTTVVDQNMTTAEDVELIRACRAEARCLVTMDLDFANPVRFDPALYSGIAVLRPGGRATSSLIDALMLTLVDAVAEHPIAGKLWIVEPNRIREYCPEPE